MITFSNSYWSNAKQSLLKTWHTTHGKFLAVALAVAIVYLPTWVYVMGRTTFVDGKSTVILNAGWLYLGLQILWQSRSQILSNGKALWDDQLIGHICIVCGAFVLPFCMHSSSLQAAVGMLVLGDYFYIANRPNYLD